MTKLTKEQSEKTARLLDEFEAARNALKDHLDELHQEMSSYYDGKSEKWQDGDRGQAYSNWMENFDGAASDLDGCVIDESSLCDSPEEV